MGRQLHKILFSFTHYSPLDLIMILQSKTQMITAMTLTLWLWCTTILWLSIAVTHAIEEKDSIPFPCTLFMGDKIESMCWVSCYRIVIPQTMISRDHCQLDHGIMKGEWKKAQVFIFLFSGKSQPKPTITD